MASKSFVNLCACLTLCRFCAETVLKDCPESDKSCRKVRRIAEKISAHVVATRNLWKLKCTAADAEQVAKRVWELGNTVLHGNREMEELIGICMALLADMTRLKGEKAEAIDRLGELMQWLLSSFDARGEKHEAYEYAGKRVQDWYRVNGMEG